MNILGYLTRMFFQTLLLAAKSINTDIPNYRKPGMENFIETDP
jgi:hypothetical protein